MSCRTRSVESFSTPSRREFLQGAAAGATALAMTAASYARVAGANDRISIGQFMSHFIDLVHFITGARFPASAVAQGDTFVWKDEYRFDCPDQVQTTLIYPEGFMVSYSTNFGNSHGNRTMMYGTQGTLDMTRRSGPTVSGEGAYEKGPLGEEKLVEPVECPDHFLDWLRCLRTRNTPVAPIEAGYQHSVACILSDLAYQTGRRQVYDREKRRISEG